MKLLFMDTETTGLECKYFEILHLALIYEDTEKKVLDHRLFRMCPTRKVDPDAMRINQITGYHKYPKPKETHQEILRFLQTYIDKFDRLDKCTPVAYNGHFDLDFLSYHFKDCNDNYLGSFINWSLLDPLAIVRFMQFKNKLPSLPNHKLETVCNYFGISIKAHDAMSDIMATRELFYKLRDL